MIERTFTHNGFTFKRIDRKRAKIAYKNGLAIVVTASNLPPFTPWHNEQILSQKPRKQFIVDDVLLENDFEKWVSSFIFYNCTNSQTGKYPAFYIPVRETDISTGEEPAMEYDYRFMEA